jgi:hypothetical protein
MGQSSRFDQDISIAPLANFQLSNQTCFFPVGVSPFDCRFSTRLLHLSSSPPLLLLNVFERRHQFFFHLPHREGLLTSCCAVSSKSSSAPLIPLSPIFAASARYHGPQITHQLWVSRPARGCHPWGTARPTDISTIAWICTTVHEQQNHQQRILPIVVRYLTRHDRPSIHL